MSMEDAGAVVSAGLVASALERRTGEAGEGHAVCSDCGAEAPGKFCAECGQPTTGEVCAFCRLRRQTLVKIGSRAAS